VLLGVTGTGKTFTMAKVIEETQRPALILAPTRRWPRSSMASSSFFPDNAVEYFVSYYDYYQPEAYVPRTDTYIEKESSINEQIDRMRHSATRALLERDDVIIVASVSCIYGIGSVETYTAMTFKLEVGERIDPRASGRPVALQYKRNDMPSSAARSGCAATRWSSSPPTMRTAPGGSPSSATSWRHHRVRPADRQESRRPEEPSRSTPTRTMSRRARRSTRRSSDQGGAEAPRRASTEHGQTAGSPALEQRTSSTSKCWRPPAVCNGIENYSRYLTGRKPGEPPPTLFEYLPDNALVFIDESHQSPCRRSARMYRGDFRRKATLAEYGFRLPSCMDNRPLKFEEWDAMRPQTVHVSATPGKWELERTGGVFAEQVIRPTGLIDPPVEVRPVSNEAPPTGRRCAGRGAAVAARATARSSPR
jgi:excinuclease ABC subunit B